MPGRNPWPGGGRCYLWLFNQTSLVMTVAKILTDEIPPLRPGKVTSYSPADIRRWGVQRFLDTVCRKEPLQIPDLGFTEEENRATDEVLRQEREATAHGL